MAYCLMGIFDVNLPLIYGEGHKAFTRLQEEILKTSEDHTIFAWVDKEADDYTFRSLLAHSPSEFYSCQSIVPVKIHDDEPIINTNRGLSIHVELRDFSTDKMECRALLNCKSLERDEIISIRLRRLFPGSNQYARVTPNKLYNLDRMIFRNYHKGASRLSNIYVPERMLAQEIAFGHRIHGFKFPNYGGGWIRKVFPSALWSKDERFLQISRETLEAGGIITANLLLVSTTSRGAVVSVFYNPSSKEQTICTPMAVNNVLSVPGFGSKAIIKYLEGRVDLKSAPEIEDSKKLQFSKDEVVPLPVSNRFLHNRGILIVTFPNVIIWALTSLNK
jgi:hypothetical protein